MTFLKLYVDPLLAFLEFLALLFYGKLQLKFFVPALFMFKSYVSSEESSGFFLAIFTMTSKNFHIFLMKKDNTPFP